MGKRCKRQKHVETKLNQAKVQTKIKRVRVSCLFETFRCFSIYFFLFYRKALTGH